MATNNAINLKAQGVAYYDGAGTFSTPTITQYAVVIGDAANDITDVGPLTNGQLVIGSTGVAPVAATLTPGVGISIANNAGSITISNTGAGFSWNDVTMGAQTLAVQNGYVTDNGAGLVTYTLPATANLGDSIAIVGFSAGGWTIAQVDDQQILIGDSGNTVGVGGSISSTDKGDCIELVCVVPGSDCVFRALSTMGNLTIV